MSTNAKRLLEELYTLDPDLLDDEEAVIRIINVMKKNKPTIEINEVFRRELRQKLVETLIYSIPKKTSNPIRWRLFFPVFGGTFAALFIAILSWNVYTDTLTKTPNLGLVSQRIVTSNTEIQPIDSPQPTMPQTQELKPNLLAPEGNTNIRIVSNKNEKTPTLPITTNTVERIAMTPIEHTSYQDMISLGAVGPTSTITNEYVYTGQIQLATGQLAVYQKEPSPLTAIDMSKIVENLSINEIKLSALENIQINTIYLSEDKEFGYTIVLDIAQGSIGFSQNNLGWPHMPCSLTGCNELTKLTHDDMPRESEIIAIGNRWLDKYAIDRNIYGSARVNMPSTEGVTKTGQLGKYVVIPETITILYPMLIDSRQVYDEFGGLKGMTLTYDLRTKKIINMYGFQKQILTKKIASPETNTGRILAMLQNAGGLTTFSEANIVSGNQKIITVQLQTPQLGYIHMLRNESGDMSNEVFVPAYIFTPIIDKKQGNIEKYIVVPAVGGYITNPILTPTIQQ